MELDETLAFVSVVRDGTFTAAGRRLGVPKSTLSRRVQRLEARLGGRLLQRTTRRIGLTEAGARYFERCRHAIEEIEEAEREASDLAGKPKGTLRVTTTHTVGRDWLARTLPEFRRRFPEITLDMDLSQRSVDLVAEGFDVAIRGGAGVDSTLIARLLHRGSIKLGAAPAYLKRCGRPEALADLADHDGVLYHSSKMRSFRLMGPDGMVDVPLKNTIRVNSFAVVHELVAQGVGVGIIEAVQGQRLFDEGRLDHILPQYGLDGGGLYAVYPSRHHLTPKVRVFIDYLVETIGVAF